MTHRANARHDERRQSFPSSQVDEHHSRRCIPANIQTADGDVWHTPGVLGLQADSADELQLLKGVCMDFNKVGGATPETTEF